MADFSMNGTLPRFSDQELVSKALEDKRRFADLVRRYEAPLLRYIVRQGCRDNALAQDILQEVFIKVYLHLNDYDSSLPFTSWIYRIAHNETITNFRKEKSRPFVFDKEENESLLEKIANEFGLSEEGEQQYEAADLQEALEKLEARYRDVLVLKFFEDKSYEEIADILQMPEGTVATLINRAKKKIRSYLEKR